jgi:hypothetical protein
MHRREMILASLALAMPGKLPWMDEPVLPPVGTRVDSFRRFEPYGDTFIKQNANGSWSVHQNFREVKS